MVCIILEGFQKVEKIHVFDDHGPVENMPFFYFHILHIFHANELLFTFWLS